MNSNRPIRIAIADDHSIVREGLTAIIDRQPDMKVVAEARDWPEAIEEVLHHRPEIAIFDLHMPGMEAADAIPAILGPFPAAQIILFSAFDTDEEVYQVLRAGAGGYILKCAEREDLMRCIRAVSRGEMWIHPLAAARLAERMRAPDLTPKEREVLQLAIAGKSNKEIGCSLDLTEGTVKVHVNHIFAKLGVTGRVAAVGVAVRRGLARLSGDQPLAAPDSRKKRRQGGAVSSSNGRRDYQRL